MSAKSYASLPSIEGSGSLSASRRQQVPVAGAAGRWQVEKKRIELDRKIEQFYDAEVSKCLDIDKVANEKITKLHNEIYYKVKWSNPPMPAVQQKLFTDYCKHLLTVGPKIQFSGVVDLKVWKKKLASSVHGKAVDEVTLMCRNLRNLIEKRDTDLSCTQANLVATTEKKNIEKDGTLRWMMEKNTWKRDEYFTVWYLAAQGKIRELDVLLNAPSKGAHIDDRDPDFGLTPLHYACKKNQYPMMKYLMSSGADLALRTPDGRTPLHLAAAYASREMVLELLGASVDYDALDNYGCTALQLAVQNKNTRTIDTLRNWTRLTLLPGEIEELDRRQLQQQQQSFASSAKSNYSQYSNNNTLASVVPSGARLLGNSNSESPSFHQPGHTLPASPSAPGWNLEVANAFQPSTGDIVDTSVPEEYQPVPAETLKGMSPALSLLTKRLNAYNMFLPRNAANYVPTEMLRSRDLSNISTMLHRSAAAAERGEWGSEEMMALMLPSQSVAGMGVGERSGFTVRSPSPFGTASNQSPVAASMLQSSHSVISVAGEGTGAMDKLHPTQQQQQEVEGGEYDDDAQFDDEYFQTQFNECMVEIRLTSKHYALCVQENFLPEAMRSLRRRWLVAKRLWGLVLLQRQQRLRREERLRREQEARMDALWTASCDFERHNAYDDEGRSLYLTVGLQLEDSVEDHHEHCVLQLPSELNASDAAVNNSLPNAKYLPRSASVEEDSEIIYTAALQPDASTRKKLVAAIQSEANSSQNSIMVDKGAIEHEEDNEGNKDKDGGVDEEEEEDGSHTSDTTLSQPAVTLERILLAYDAEQALYKIEEENPRPENQSASTLLRPVDYDSVGAPVYKVKDNVYWETESFVQRRNAGFNAQDASSSITSPSSHPLGQGELAVAEKRPTSADPLLSSAGEGAKADPLLDGVAAPFEPSASQETDAWAAIQQWHYVAEERRNRRPNVDIYSSANDECISTTSLLTYSVTDAPSTGGRSHRLDSPGGSSIVTQSCMLSYAEEHSFAAGSFKESARGNYIIKLGMDLYGVYLVRKEEGDALRILRECVEVDQEVDATLKISLLEKQVDLLLHLHDFFQRTRDSIEAALRGEGKNEAAVFARLKLKVPTVRAAPSVRTIMTERVLNMLAAVERLQHEQEQNDEDRDKESDMYDKNNFDRVGGETQEVSGEYKQHSPQLEDFVSSGCSTGKEPDGTKELQDESVESIGVEHLQNTDRTLEQHTHDPIGVVGADGLEQGQGLATTEGVRFSATLVSLEAASDAVTEQSNAAISRLSASQQTILAHCAHLAEQSVGIHREAYSADLVEPATLAIAFMQRARVAERQFDGTAAMEFTEQAEVAAVRALGGGSQLAIGIMLESLRLFVKYRLFDKADLEEIARKARDINKYIVQFSFTDIKEADKFTQKCVEYLSISTVAIREKEAKVRQAAAEAKLAAEREAQRKIVEAQKGVGRKGKF